ncbi:hypothetical protein DVH24_018935 [Malus domestica]|uniref:Uncharacterized protein n=1 Tax=Malus domestica TaxID=3750 RepID=A0A498HLJ5_MALDO|nr:hypothetical protein DVH24_018935 [Malus domestica]
MNFRTIKIRGQYKVAPHETQIILTDTKVLKKLSNVFPPIPRHRKEELSITLSKSQTLPTFSNSKDPVKTLPPSSSQLNEAEVLRITRRVTIDELA